MSAGLDDLLPSRRRLAGRSKDDDVQLSVRVSPELRRRVRDVAAAGGISAAELVESAVVAELARRTDPAAAFAADVAASLQRRMAAALSEGSWRAMVDDIVAEDPDLEMPDRPACPTV